ncbi:MAG: low molecular weight phosphotyrosine protein phosphatase [Butyrivibrio sp.]|nr:low molecular weight phosphotyrosine protein phosphatase [Butyrivibrio sp.]
MIRILFVCHGNICRSPIGEFLMKDIVSKQGLSEAFHIESSATHTDEIWNGVGSPIYPPAKAKLREHGIGTDDNELGVSAKRARLTSRTDYDKFDFIIGMDSANIRNLKSLFGSDPEHKVFKMLDFADNRSGYGTGNSADVADPWYTGDFNATWRDVSDGCHGLFRKILTDSKYAKELSEKIGDSDELFEQNNEKGLSYDDFPRG